jgi:hypothetical protein
MLVVCWKPKGACEDIIFDEMFLTDFLVLFLSDGRILTDGEFRLSLFDLFKESLLEVS